MTEPQHTPQAGIADALSQLSEETRVLVRQEIDAAQREMWRKATRSAPGLALLAAAGVLGVFAGASSYRLGMRLLDKALPPASAALVATAGFGAGAGAAASAGLSRLRHAPLPVPTETAAATGRTAAEAATQARQ